MEIPEIYTRMCDCEEVQSLDGGGLYEMATPYGDVLFYTNDKKGCDADVWLPSQSQLQVMLRRFYDEDSDRPDSWYPIGEVGLTFVMRKFNDFTIRSTGDLTSMAYEAKSFEEIWLQVYMYEAHGKFWGYKGMWVDVPMREIPITQVKGSDGHKERLKEINKILNDPDAKKKQKENWAEMKRMGRG